MVDAKNIGRLLYFYRWNILLPGTVGSIIAWDYLRLRKKKIDRGLL